MKKISIGKNDELSLVAEKIINTDESDVVLSVPRFSKLVGSPINFELLKREADASGKTLIVESVDENILIFAQQVGLEAYNPFFQSTKKTRQMSDIISPSRQHNEEAVPEVSTREASEYESDEESEYESESYSPKKKRNYFRLGSVLVVLIAVVALGYGTALYFSKAKITITLDKYPWEYSGIIKADKSIATIKIEQSVIPGVPLIEKKNSRESFPASGEKYVERKAAGTITIYNAFSSEPQPLVKTTRFEAPNGSIYRIDSDIVVPGAKIIDGKVVPEGISATVTADKAGKEHNIGPTDRFSIPGFKGSPKYETFYGTSEGSIDGGFIGNQPYPTDEDIKLAKEKVSEILQNSLQVTISGKLPQEFKFLDGATSATITRQTVIPEVDSEGKFSVVGEAEISAFGFKEQDLLTLFTDKARNSGALEKDVVLRDYNIEYSDVELSEDGSTLTFEVSMNGNFVIPIDEQKLILSIAGLEREDVEALIGSTRGVSGGALSSWPKTWNKLPKNPEKITIVVE